MHSRLTMRPQLSTADPSAVALVSAIKDAFDWNDNQTSLLDPSHSWVNAFGGGATHAYTTSLFGKKAMLSVQSYCQLSSGMSSYVAATDALFFAQIMYLDTTTAGKEILGFGESDAHAIRTGIEVTISGGAASVRLAVIDASNPVQPILYSPAASGLSTGYHLFIGSYDPAERRWTFMHNDTTVGQTAVYYTGGYPYGISRWKHVLDPYAGIAFGDLPRVLHEDEFYGFGLVIDSTIRDYLYNGGSFKTYAQIVADS